MSKAAKTTATVLTAYAVGIWLTFGYTLTYNMDTAICRGCKPWDYSLSIVASLLWPLYWFYKSAIIAFGWQP